MARRKVVFVIVEGASDETALGIALNQDDGIHTSDVRKVISRNKQKTDNLYRIRNCGNIWGVPYRVYYMSCNLDHVLYDKRNSTDEEEGRGGYIGVRKRLTIGTRIRSWGTCFRAERFPVAQIVP